MQDRLFRRSALDRLSSPEQLDQLLTITTPRSWLVLLGFALLIGAVLIWAFLGSVATTVDGEGILLRGGRSGTENISASSTGIIGDIYVDVGDSIESGQVVARILQNNSTENVRVISSFTGRIIEIRVAQDNFVQIGEPLIILEATSGDSDLQAIVYLPATDGKRVQPGMRVQLLPSTVRSEEVGVLLGWVTSVGEFPESSQAMLNVLNNEELVTRFTEASDNTPIEVRIDLIPDRDTVSRYQWSSPEGPDSAIESGTLTDATIILEDKAPIELIFSN